MHAKQAVYIIKKYMNFRCGFKSFENFNKQDNEIAGLETLIFCSTRTDIAELPDWANFFTQPPRYCDESYCAVIRTAAIAHSNV